MTIFRHGEIILQTNIVSQYSMALRLITKYKTRVIQISRVVVSASYFTSTDILWFISKAILLSKNLTSRSSSKFRLLCCDISTLISWSCFRTEEKIKYVGNNNFVSNNFYKPLKIRTGSYLLLSIFSCWLKLAFRAKSSAIFPHTYVPKYVAHWRLQF